MCCCEGYGFQAVWSGIGFRNQGVLVQNRVLITGKLVSGVTNLDRNRV